MKSKSSLFIIIVAIVLIGGGLVYFFVIRKGDLAPVAPTTGLVSTNTGKSTGIAVAQTGNTGDQVVSLLRNLSTIQLNDALFQNPSFALLQDLSITLPPVTNQGRRNPFAAANNEITIQDVTPKATMPGSSGLTPGPTTGQ